jgi:eukaryotic-like serine/threonine-protein kinase
MRTEASHTEKIPESSDLEDAIFDTAIHIEDPEERRVFLERSFHGDPEGLARMSELLDLAGESAAFFIETRKHRDLLAEDTLMAMREEEFGKDFAPMAEDAPGSTIGRYRLIGRIGSGGGGIVYEAEQQEPVVRRVALKVIRLGMDTETVIARFEVERQALALMDHPNIARVLDAGATASGRPYFVMELVKGDRITTYCDDERLDVTARLRLFIQVCHAIQHAHQKGIIHRDIKPSNILVATHDCRR